MKNKFLALLLAITFLVPFNSQVSAGNSDENDQNGISPYVLIPTVIAGATVIIGAISYAGYKINDYYFKNKMITFVGSIYADSRGPISINPRDDLLVSDYIRRLFETEIPKLRRDNTFEAKHLANLDYLFMTIILHLDSVIATPEARTVADCFRAQGEIIMRLVRTNQTVTVQYLIDKLREIDILARQATALINKTQ